ncbi:MAG: hypothetical protein KAV87_62635, partial [Desulfobacteraceae bacterium]|nr:hypothetical protein [Desulfobacteraceae bacterium]
KKALKALAHVVRLQKMTGRELLPLLALWSDIDIESDRLSAKPKRCSLYETVFQNPTLDESAIEVFALTSTDTHYIRDHRPAIQAALDLTGAELSRLEMREFGLVAEQDDANPGPEINHNTLSRLYRYVSLARAMSISIIDCLAWQQLLRVDPFAGPAQTVEFVKTVRSISEAGVQADDALYYFHHDSAVVERYEPDEATLGQQLWNLRRALRDVSGGGNDEQTLSLPLREFLATNISDPNAVEDVLALIADTSTKSSSEQENLVDSYLAGFLDANRAKQNLVQNGLSDQKQRWDYVEQAAKRKRVESDLVKNLNRAHIEATIHQPVIHLAHNPPQSADEPAAKQLLEQQQMRLVFNPPDAHRRLVDGGGQLKQKDQRFAYLSSNLVRHGKRITELEKSLSAILHLDVTVVHFLLRNMSYDGLHLGEILLDPVFIEGVEATTAPAMHGIDEDLNVRNQPRAFNALMLLTKVARLYGQLEIGAELHRSLVDNAQSFGMACPWLLPPGDNAPSHIPPDQWWRLIVLRRLERKLPGNSPVLSQILCHIDAYNSAAAGPEKKVAFDKVVAMLALRTGWSVDDIRHIFLNVIGLSNPKVELRMHDLFRMLRCCDLIRRTGASSVQLHNGSGWTENSQALAIREAVASRFDQENWLEVSRGIHDRLRIKQRDALIAYLINNDDRFHDSKAIYAHFLVDPEMNPCRATSRVRLAIGSVQLYVQRHFLGLEGEQTLTEADAKEWKWRKLYRVWEANRNVFLYPENWIYPELRKDKSEQFQSLENELKQRELSSKNAEAVVARYVSDLDELSRLEPVGFYCNGSIENLDIFEGRWRYWSPTFSDSTIFYIIARSRSEPRQYFYRTFGFDRYQNRYLNDWSAWKRINLKISSEQISPIIYRGRLFLFWPTLTKGQPKPGEESESWVVKLNYSELKGDSWGPVKYSKELVTNISTHENTELFSLSPIPRIDHLEVSLNWESPTAPILRREYVFKLFEPTGSPVGLRSWEEKDTYRPWYLRPEYGHWRIMPTDDPSHVVAVAIPGPGVYLNRDVRIFQLITGKPPSGFGYAGGFEPAKSEYEYIPLSSARVMQVDGGGKFCFYIAWDHLSAFIIRLRSISLGISGFINYDTYNYTIYRLHHPWASHFVDLVATEGLDGLMNRQILGFEFPTDPYKSNEWEEDDTIYELPTHIHGESSFKPDNDQIQFSQWAPYSLYNWELFFHIPFLVAQRLQSAQRFEEAMSWYHYVFEPMNQERRYWKFTAFRGTHDDPIQLLMREIIGPFEITVLGVSYTVYSDIWLQLASWARSPFDPHAVALFRKSAYQKAIVQRYLDNILEWGDYLFRQHTRESINEATQLYILAAEILGERPREVKERGQRTQRTYNELKALGLDDFSNVLVPLENLIPEVDLNGAEVETTNKEESLPEFPSLYFCVPHNPELLDYWDKVEKRLYKIRHCLDIEGGKRTLPLWEPPIDPEILVRATAAGVDIDSVLADLDAPLGYYRFNIVLQKAQALTTSARQLGNALQSALEKRNAEELATLRSGLELDVLEAVLEMHQDQVEEARRNIAAVRASQRVVEERKKHYEHLIEVGLITQEQMQLQLLQSSREMQEHAEWSEKFASTMAALPNISAGLSGKFSYTDPQPGWSTGTSFGGSNLSAIYSAEARGRYTVAKALEYHANRMSIDAGHSRRSEDWNFQSQLAEREIEQMEKQIATAEIREAIAEKERENQRLQIKNAQQVHEWMQRKYTNQELYEWMHGQLRSLYYQSYNLAYDVAKRAERCFRHELGVTDPAPIIEYGNWDNQRQGLLAAERLQGQLEKLEVAYIENNRRELELRKHISLSLLDPVALLAFRETGVCFFSLPEALFDLELPGHYMRRLKSVSLSIPSVTGPYTNISATLTMQSSW